MFWSGKRVLVTGGAGFLGSFVVEKLRARGCSEILVPRSERCDLREVREVEKVFAARPPHIVIHLAASIGGIGAHVNNPGTFFYDNAIMGIQLMEHARRAGTEKFVTIGTVCSYPRVTPLPFKEESLWDGYSDETTAPYGLAKKILLVQAQAYRRQFGFNGIYLIPTNLYGPRDNFDLETAHVVPALIRKCLEAKESGESEVVVWGDGTASREMLFVEDAAEAILLATEKYNDREPVNIGSGQEVPISELIKTIAIATGFKGKIVWDKTKPNGQPRRCLDISRAREGFGFTPKKSLDSGIAETVNWFLANEQAYSVRKYGT